LGTVILAAVLAVAVGILTKSPIALAIAITASVVIGVASMVWLQRKSRSTAMDAFLPAAQSIANAEAFLPRCVADQKALCERRQMENLAQRDHAIQSAEAQSTAIIE